jgi:hypothetical protein
MVFLFKASFLRKVFVFIISSWAVLYNVKKKIQVQNFFAFLPQGTQRGKPQPKRTRLALKLQITKYKLQRGALRADFNQLKNNCKCFLCRKRSSDEFSWTLSEKCLLKKQEVTTQYHRGHRKKVWATPSGCPSMARRAFLKSFWPTFLQKGGFIQR